MILVVLIFVDLRISLNHKTGKLLWFYNLNRFSWYFYTLNLLLQVLIQ